MMSFHLNKIIFIYLFNSVWLTVSRHFVQLKFVNKNFIMTYLAVHTSEREPYSLYTVIQFYSSVKQ
jgi:hypothetical protein